LNKQIMAENDDISDDNSRRLNLPRRELAKREIHRLIVSEGLTNAQLSARLNLPRRTLERYLHEIFQEDCDILMRPTAQEVSMEAAKLRERLMERRQKILKIADDETVDPETRLHAEELAIKIDSANLKLVAAPPAVLERQMRRPDGIPRREVPTSVGALGVEASNLIVKKEEQQQ
jgi:DNA-binding CsgD family transcriptional regulator